ncbi:MAG: hypothetical protein GX613_01435 [Chloroflexi bacterium]|nr:hypothetical protein [Chloroflexota bacterium]
MPRLSSIVQSVIATAFIWVGVVLVRLVGGVEGGMLDFALFAGFGATIALWLVWAFAGMDRVKNESKQLEKSKRAPEDARLSLLLQMMNEDERANLKDRLRDELSTDGEAVALEDLLDERSMRK